MRKSRLRPPVAGELRRHARLELWRRTWPWTLREFEGPIAVPRPQSSSRQKRRCSMHRARQVCRCACRLVLAIVCIVLIEPPPARGQLRPYPAAMDRASAELIDRLRADPFNYFRFVNRPWTERVCEAFADVSDLPIVRLHGDAHLEQFALTNHAWGLDDFDDSARGPAFVDIVRFQIGRAS